MKAKCLLIFILAIFLSLVFLGETQAGIIKGHIYYKDLQFTESQVVGFQFLPLRSAWINLLDSSGNALGGASGYSNDVGSYNIQFNDLANPSQIEVCASYADNSGFGVSVYRDPRGTRNRRLKGKNLCESFPINSFDSSGTTTKNFTVDDPGFNIFDVLLWGYDYVRGFNLNLPVHLSVWTPNRVGDTSFGGPDEISIDLENQFDDFGILHEFGHFVQYTLGQDLSPGGEHFPDSFNHPALAFSEGWATYLSSAVRLIEPAYVFSPPTCFASWLTSDNRLAGILPLEQLGGSYILSEFNETSIAGSLFDLVDEPGQAACIQTEAYDKTPAGKSLALQKVLLDALADLKNINVLGSGESTTFEAFFRRAEKRAPAGDDPLSFATGTWSKESDFDSITGDGPFEHFGIFFYQDGPYNIVGSGGQFTFREPNDAPGFMGGPGGGIGDLGLPWIFLPQDFPAIFTLVPSPLSQNNPDQGALRPLKDTDCYEVPLGPFRGAWTDGQTTIGSGSRELEIDAELPPWFGFADPQFFPILQIEAFKPNTIPPLSVGSEQGGERTVSLLQTIQVEDTVAQAYQDSCTFAREQFQQNSGDYTEEQRCYEECNLNNICQNVCVQWRQKALFCVSGINKSNPQNIHYVAYQLSLGGVATIPDASTCPEPDPCDHCETPTP